MVFTMPTQIVNVIGSEKIRRIKEKKNTEKPPGDQYRCFYLINNIAKSKRKAFLHQPIVK